MSQARGARWPGGLIGLVGLVLIVDGLLARFEDPFFTTVWATDWRLTARAAGREALGREVLCFGDSLVKFGVLPRVIEARAGRSAYSLAINAAPTPTSYFLLRRALEAGARPRAVVVDFFPLLIADDPWKGLRNYPELISTRDGLDLACTAGDPGLFAALTLGRLLPSVRARFEIRASLLAALRGGFASWPDGLRVGRRNWAVNRGAQPLPSGRHAPEGDGPLIRACCPVSWSCDRLNRTYLERFLRLAAAYGVRVYWLLPPMDPAVRERRARSGVDAAYTRLAREVQARFPDVTVIDARDSGYGASVHVDPLHLDRRGAFALSTEVAAVLARDLAGAGPASRWVALPPYAARPIDVPLEDFAESRIALLGR
jgi:hypothetical protein